MRDEHDNVIHLIYGSDANYMFPTAVSAASAAFQISQEWGLIVHLFDFGASDAQCAEMADMLRVVNSASRFERHKIDVSEYRMFGAWRGSLATYSRMFVPEILSDVDWAIYVDGDTLWLGDIGELWQLRNASVSILASVDPPTPSGKPSAEFDWFRERKLEIDEKTYFCAGLILMNLVKMRRECMTARCRAFLTKYPIPRIVDQTVLNYVLQGDSQLLPPQWGVFSTWHEGVDLSRPACVHYVNDVPWSRKKINRLLSDVVMLWFHFCWDVLGRDVLRMDVPWLGRLWRRVAFVLLKNNQWVLFHPYIRARLRNTHGIPVMTMRCVREQWKRLKVRDVSEKER